MFEVGSVAVYDKVGLRRPAVTEAVFYLLPQQESAECWWFGCRLAQLIFVLDEEKQ